MAGDGWHAQVQLGSGACHAYIRQPAFFFHGGLVVVGGGECVGSCRVGLSGVAAEDRGVETEIGQVVEPVGRVGVARGADGLVVSGIAQHRVDEVVERQPPDGGGEHCGDLETQPQVGGVAVGQRSGPYGECRAAPERGRAHAVDLRGGLLAGARVRRQVDEPAHRLVVGVGVGGGLKAGERVADLRPVVEALVAGDPVRDAGPLEGGFERSRLRVGAVEDRDRPVVACDPRDGAVDGEARLGRRVSCVVDGRGQARRVDRGQAVVEAVGVVAD